ncbi:MAG: hypothetical protein GXO79_01835 [Chlorobi bacterium]|nr:hypothetical protein [Chlorobiota bacterium]
MTNAIKYVFFLLIIIQFSVVMQAQEGDEVFIMDNAIYKPKSNWLTLGVGYAYNIDKNESELGGSIVYHAQLKKIVLSGGYHLFTNESFISRSYQSMTNFTIGVGYRKETLKSNIAAFIGPLYAYGRKTVNQDQYYKFRSPGFFVNVAYTHKLFYDIGFGPTIFYHFSKYYQVIGIELHVYFSGALKTKIKQPKINY